MVPMNEKCKKLFVEYYEMVGKIAALKSLDITGVPDQTGERREAVRYLVHETGVVSREFIAEYATALVGEGLVGNMSAARDRASIVLFLAPREDVENAINPVTVVDAVWDDDDDECDCPVCASQG